MPACWLSRAAAPSWLLLRAPAQAAAGSPVQEASSPESSSSTQQTVPVRIALIGFGDEVDDDAEILSWLPPTYRPVVRYPRFYGLEGRDLGLDYEFEYSVERKTSGLHQAVLHLPEERGCAGPGARLYQEVYNDQASNVLDVTGPVLYIDAPAGRAMARTRTTAGRGRSAGTPIYFVNWYGRSDFQFHVYTKTDEPDPDTRYNFGRAARVPEDGLVGRHLTAGAGSTISRPGPEAWAGNFDVDDDDLDGDGVEDYRIPPIWEYGPGRLPAPAEHLSDDMGLLDALRGHQPSFTTSPLYDPLVSAPEPRGRKVAHIAMLEDEAGASGLDWFHADVRLEQWQAVPAVLPVEGGPSPTRTRSMPGPSSSLDIFAGNSDADDCWNEFGGPAVRASSSATSPRNFSTYVPPYTAATHVERDLLLQHLRPTGWAASSACSASPTTTGRTARRPTSSSSAAPPTATLGFGFTSTIVHEFGHHIGMSHPARRLRLRTSTSTSAPSGPFYFAWLGDESDTVMHYIAVSNGFGRHNQDNMYRWETAGYLNWANALAGDILASPDPAGSRPACRPPTGRPAWPRRPSTGGNTSPPRATRARPT